MRLLLLTSEKYSQFFLGLFICYLMYEALNFSIEVKFSPDRIVWGKNMVVMWISTLMGMKEKLRNEIDDIIAWNHTALI